MRFAVDGTTMSAKRIRILKPNVTQEEALSAFSSAGASALYWRIRSGRLRRIADVYVPYFLFYVKSTAMPPRLFAIDAVDGSLDFPVARDSREFEQVQRAVYGIDGKE